MQGQHSSSRAGLLPLASEQHDVSESCLVRSPQGSIFERPTVHVYMLIMVLTPDRQGLHQQLSLCSQVRALSPEQLPRRMRPPFSHLPPLNFDGHACSLSLDFSGGGCRQPRPSDTTASIMQLPHLPACKHLLIPLVLIVCGDHDLLAGRQLDWLVGVLQESCPDFRSL